ncbi:MAG: hypothetical protein WD851_16385 [Pirellulales bacterium]
MAYQRPINPSPLSNPEKLALLQEYTEHYRQLIETDASVLNRKVPKDVFAHVLDRVGEMLLDESERLATSDGPVRIFLDANPLPLSLAQRLPDDFRVFCLALNSLKQWVAAEQGATDRYLLGGAARDLCREAAETCLVAGTTLGQDAQLHHPVRDGRPPIPLSKIGHASIEGQLLSMADDPIGQVLLDLRREGNRSWAQLRRGCLDLLGRPEPWPSKASANGARTFAKTAVSRTKVGPEQILQWMDRKAL